MESREDHHLELRSDTISTVNSFSGIVSISHNNANKFVKMKSCIAAIEKYSLTRSSDELIVINRLLQALSVTSDLSVFDPHTNIAGKFYISVLDLMKILEPRSLTTWYCIDMLLNACKNTAAKQALLTIYQFLPSLSHMMSDQLTAEKKASLLKLMQSITCGMRIYWQLPNMAHLITTLCKWIDGQDSEICALSLGVLVNLCYKNVSSIFILQQNIDLKRFIRKCLALKGPYVEVYVCFMTIILENVCGYIPVVVVSTLIHNVCAAVLEAYRRKDGLILRQIVEFFIEWVKSSSSVLTGYNKYREQVESMLQLIEDSGTSVDPETLSAMLDLINFFVETEVPQISSLYPQLITLALKWIQESTASYRALSLLKNLVLSADKNDDNILEPLMAGQKVFLLIFNSALDENVMDQSEHVKRLGAMLQLLTAMIQMKAVGQKLARELHQDVVKHLFQPLLGDGSPRSNECTCSEESVNLYIYALGLVGKLEKCDSNWMCLLNSLLQERQIHSVIAQALCNSPKHVKKLALELSSSCSDGVASALENLQSVMSSGTGASASVSSVTSPPEQSFSVIPLGQIERLDNILSVIETLISKKEFDNLAISDLMELYNYKVSNISQAERAAQVSLDASNRFNSHLQHRLTRLTHEHNQLQQSTVFTTKKLDDISKKNRELCEEVGALEDRFEAEKGQIKVLREQLKAKEKALTECEATLKDTEQKRVKLQQWFNKVEENCRRLERNEVKKDEIIEKCNNNIKTLTLQVTDLEKCLKEKEKILDETRISLREKTMILDSITKMASSQSKT